MKDLDFDELDRAVSSLMTDVDTNELAEPDEKVVTIPSTLGAGDIPHFPPSTNTTLPQPSSPLNEAPIVASLPPEVSSTTLPMTSTSPAARRSGRFMDVVDPSSDMKTATMLDRMSRVGTTVTAPIVEPSTSEEETSSISETSVVGEPALSSDNDMSAPSSWPDPIDFNATKEVPMANDEELTPDEVTAEPLTPVEGSSEDSEAVSDSDDLATPLQSPFLSDAKVEKRPLGAFAQTSDDMSADTAREQPESVEPVRDGVDTATSVEPDPQVVEATPPAVLPDELQGDIVAIEADTTPSNVVPESAAVASPTPYSQPVVPVTNTGPTSIKQQYTEEPSTTPSEHAAIYDSPAYTQPLAHPAKKKSGWLVVLLVVILVIIGAGGGAALYFFVLK